MSIRVREVVLEILRHGPAHNQLLSPLTRYLALCGSHPAVSLTVPFEHRELRHLLSRMSYPEGISPADARERAFALDKLSSAVTGFLEQIPALPHEGRVDRDEVLHLRLMITPQELALLPFELAGPPSGFDSGGQPLLLGPTPDVVLTREVRRSASVRVLVPPRPRVLLAIADPTGRGVPADATCEAIAAALRPWGRPGARDGTLRMDLTPYLVVVKNASLDEIREHCATGGFTHVHILAHGAALAQPGREGFGLALCDRNDKERDEVVDGLALARALRPPTHDSSWASPWCVVLCTCESGNIGDVVHPTASLAHALHVAGIPLVVASQYPLTFGAAVKLAETFYALELRGEDPRRTLRDVRHAIASHMRRTHDWASLVAYAGLPADVGQQLEQIRVVRAFAQLEAAQDWADRVIAKTDLQPDADGGKEILARSLSLVEAAADGLRREALSADRQRQEIRRRDERGEISKHERGHLMGKVTSLLTEIYGLLGSASKRCARLYHHQGRKDRARSTLRQAASWYLEGVALQAPEHWTACQSFVMLGLGCGPEGWVNEQERESAREQWRIAAENAERALDDPSGRPWAYGTLIEVELWRPLLGIPEDSSQADRERCATDALQRAGGYLRKLVAGVRADPFPLKSTVRQLRRYRDWWGPAEYVDADMVARVNELLEVAGPDVLAQEDEEQASLDIDLPEILDGASLEAAADQVLGSGRVVSVAGDDEEAAGAVFRVQMLPARQGDALWIEYGEGEDVHRILIDGGFRTTVRTVEQRIRDLAADSPAGKCHFELGVVSHIDADHIEGMIEMIGGSLPVSFGDLWFNGRKHLDVPAVEASLDEEGVLGGKHGLFLDMALDLSKTRWNGGFDGGAIVVPPGSRGLPTVTLPGGMQLTLLSPTPPKLDALAKRWDSEVRKAGLEGASYAEVLAAMDRLHYSTGALEGRLLRHAPSGPLDVEALLEVPDGADDSPANGSSIAFLAVYGGRSCLFMADAHPDAMLQAIDRMAGKRKRLAVGAVKLSHHGSGNNVTLELLRRIDSRVFLVSTNGGGGHYHPDRHAIAKLVAGRWRPKEPDDYPITILFNYRTDYTEVWDDEELKNRYGYSVAYADPGDILELAAVPRTPAG